MMSPTCHCMISRASWNECCDTISCYLSLFETTVKGAPCFLAEALLQWCAAPKIDVNMSTQVVSASVSLRELSVCCYGKAMLLASTMLLVTLYESFELFIFGSDNKV